MTLVYVAIISAIGAVLAAYVGKQVSNARTEVKKVETVAVAVDDHTIGLYRAIEEASRGRVECEEKMHDLQQAHAILQERHAVLQKELERLKDKIDNGT